MKSSLFYGKLKFVKQILIAMLGDSGIFEKGPSFYIKSIKISASSITTWIILRNWRHHLTKQNYFGGTCWLPIIKTKDIFAEFGWSWHSRHWNNVALVSILLTHFNPMLHFYKPLKMSANQRFSGGIEMEHWTKMG